MNSIVPSGGIRDLKVGEKVSFNDDTFLTILDAQKNGKIWLGKGGQGIVYLADYKGKQYAFKWFINESFVNSEDKSFYNNIINLSSKASERKMRNFMLPIKVTDPEPSGQFGYLMNLIDTSKYVELKDILSRKYSFDNLEHLLLACENIAKEMPVCLT